MILLPKSLNPMSNEEKEVCDFAIFDDFLSNIISILGSPCFGASHALRGDRYSRLLYQV